jgi:hypothetical protein
VHPDVVVGEGHDLRGCCLNPTVPGRRNSGPTLTNDPDAGPRGDRLEDLAHRGRFRSVVDYHDLEVGIVELGEGLHARSELLGPAEVGGDYYSDAWKWSVRPRQERWTVPHFVELTAEVAPELRAPKHGASDRNFDESEGRVASHGQDPQSSIPLGDRVAAVEVRYRFFDVDDRHADRRRLGSSLRAHVWISNRVRHRRLPHDD